MTTAQRRKPQSHLTGTVLFSLGLHQVASEIVEQLLNTKDIDVTFIVETDIRESDLKLQDSGSFTQGLCVVYATTTVAS